MGIFDKLLGGSKKEYPKLEPSDPQAAALQPYEGGIAKLGDDISDDLEVVPGDEAAYIFIGKPPKKFGFAWVENDEVHNFGEVAQKRNLNPMTVQLISEQLRDTYKEHGDAARFSASVKGRPVVLTHSKPLAKTLSEIVHKVAP